MAIGVNTLQLCSRFNWQVKSLHELLICILHGPSAARCYLLENTIDRMFRRVALSLTQTATAIEFELKENHKTKRENWVSEENEALCLGKKAEEKKWEGRPQSRSRDRQNYRGDTKAKETRRGAMICALHCLDCEHSEAEWKSMTPTTPKWLQCQKQARDNQAHEKKVSPYKPTSLACFQHIEEHMPKKMHWPMR